VNTGAPSEAEPNQRPDEASGCSIIARRCVLEVLGLAGESRSLRVQDLYLLDFSALPAPARTDKPHGDCQAVQTRQDAFDTATLTVTLLQREGDTLSVVAEQVDGTGGLNPPTTLIAGVDYLLAVDMADAEAGSPYVLTLACNQAPQEPPPVTERLVASLDWFEITLDEEGPLDVSVSGAPFVVTAAGSLDALFEAQRVGEDADYRVTRMVPAGTYRVGVGQAFRREYEIVAFY
jgi:hypothetical protein